MNKTELATIFSAGLTIINAGSDINGSVTQQNESDLDLFETLIKSRFGNLLTQDIVEYEMDNREMIRNLVQFGTDTKKQGLDFIAELNRRLSNSESKSVCDEVVRVINEKKLDPLNCPMLDALVAMEDIADQYK